MTPVLASSRLTGAQFQKIRDLLYETSRIDLSPSKQPLVEARLAKRVRNLGLEGFDHYLELVQEGGARGERAFMVDALTTNKTSFFREDKHYHYVRDRLLPDLQAGGRARIWSAGCSSGEEPYTLAMVLCETWKQLERADVRILATDLSDTVLTTARAGAYGEDHLAEVPQGLRSRYFARRGDGPRPWQVSPRLAELISFAPLNLMGRWPMRGPFDFIFCRNVMIYFDKSTQEALVSRFHALLPAGGHLFISHSESLTGVAHDFDYVQPGVYVR